MTMTKPAKTNRISTVKHCRHRQRHFRHVSDSFDSSYSNVSASLFSAAPYRRKITSTNRSSSPDLLISCMLPSLAAPTPHICFRTSEYHSDSPAKRFASNHHSERPISRRGDHRSSAQESNVPTNSKDTIRSHCI